MPEHNIEDEFELVNFITLRRIYDVLAGIYASIDGEAADRLMTLHEQGIFITPPPAYRPGEDDE